MSESIDFVQVGEVETPEIGDVTTNATDGDVVFVDAQTGELSQPKRKRAKRIQVTVVKPGKTALVQWQRDGRQRRGYVPAEAIVGNAVGEDELEAAVGVGAEWEQFVEAVTVTPAQVGEALRAAGFWTVDDIEANVQRAQVVVSKLLGINVAVMARKARRK